VRAPHLTDHDAASLRQAVNLTATVRVSGAALCVQRCRVRSLSLGGAFLERDWLPMGTLINITLHLPSLEDRLSFDAIVHGRARGGISVLFDSLRASELWALWRYLSSLTNETELEVTKRVVMGSSPGMEPLPDPSLAGAIEHPVDQGSDASSARRMKPSAAASLDHLADSVTAPK
jgi:hypothetical protein